MQNTDISKAAGIDNLSGKLLKDGAEIIVRHLSKICNLSITICQLPLELFQMPAKLQISHRF